MKWLHLTDMDTNKPFYVNTAAINYFGPSAIHVAKSYIVLMVPSPGREATLYVNETCEEILKLL